MKISKPLKIFIGLLTAWELIAPFLFMVLWFFTIAFIVRSAESSAYPNDYLFPTFFLPYFMLIFCSSFIMVALQIFYLSHIILNKAASDVLRIIFGALTFLFAPIALPIYYFIYILPDHPPEWAIATNPANPVTPSSITPNTLSPTP